MNNSEPKEDKGRKTVKVCGCDPVAGNPATEQDQPLKPGRKKCSKRNTKAKGDGEERSLVKWCLQRLGLTAYRTAGSGAHGTRTNESAFATDVRVAFGQTKLRFECKRYAKIPGLKSLLGLLSGSDVLWVREDFAEPYVLMSAEVYAASLEAYAAEKGAK